MRIGELIKTWREANGHGTREIAMMLDMSHATLNRIENDENVDHKTLMKLINYYLNPKPLP